LFHSCAAIRIQNTIIGFYGFHGFFMNLHASIQNAMAIIMRVGCNNGAIFSSHRFEPTNCSVTYPLQWRRLRPEM
jgi:hypothetical protein